MYAAACDDIYSSSFNVMNSSESVKVAELDNGELYCITGDLYVTDGHIIKPFDGEGTCYVYWESACVTDDYLIQYQTTSESESVLTILSVEEGYKEKSVKDPVSFTYNEKQIVVYAEESIETFDCD